MSISNEKMEYDHFPLNIFIDALYDSVHRMCGIDLCEASDIRMAKSKAKVVGAMVLQGAVPALLTIETNHQSALKIVSFMTGIDSIEVTDSLLEDGIAEIVNMVAGGARAALVNTDYVFELTVPFTIIGSDIELIVKKRTVSYMSKLDGDGVSITIRVITLK